MQHIFGCLHSLTFAVLAYCLLSWTKTQQTIEHIQSGIIERWISILFLMTLICFYDSVLDRVLPPAASVPYCWSHCSTLTLLNRQFLERSSFCAHLSQANLRAGATAEPKRWRQRQAAIDLVVE